MNREILFKGKEEQNGNWIQGDLIHRIAGPTIGTLDSDGLHEAYVDEETICRYTGLVDKNGKEIWENDILMSHKDQSQLVKVVFGEFAIVDVETLEAVDHAIGWHYEVIPTCVLDEYKPFCFSMPLTSNYINLCEFEVIGNIFDIPELVRGEAK